MKITDEHFSELEKIKPKDLSKLISDGLNDIWRMARLWGDENPSKIDVKIARIQFLLSRQAEEQTKKIICLTRWIIFWTILVAVLTVILVLKDVGVLPIVNSPKNNHIQNSYSNEKEKYKDTVNIVKPISNDTNRNSSNLNK